MGVRLRYSYTEELSVQQAAATPTVPHSLQRTARQLLPLQSESIEGRFTRRDICTLEGPPVLQVPKYEVSTIRTAIPNTESLRTPYSGTLDPYLGFVFLYTKEAKAACRLSIGLKETVLDPTRPLCALMVLNWACWRA